VRPRAAPQQGRKRVDAERAGTKAAGARRRSALKRGATAERVVADYLVARGLVLLGTNVRVGRFEIDVLARDGDTIVVVEVRTRGARAWQTAFDSIDARKIERVRRAGERLWETRFASDPSVERMRFDAASVRFDATGETIVEYATGVL
jgi:putative endonuclease